MSSLADPKENKQVRFNKYQSADPSLQSKRQLPGLKRNSSNLKNEAKHSSSRFKEKPLPGIGSDKGINKLKRPTYLRNNNYDQYFHTNINTVHSSKVVRDLKHVVHKKNLSTSKHRPMLKTSVPESDYQETGVAMSRRLASAQNSIGD